MIKSLCKAILCIPLAAAAATLPQSLLYQGKPIDPLCFSEAQTDTIDLTQCGNTIDKFTITGHNTTLIKQDYIGFDYKSGAMQGYSYYQLIANTPQNTIIYVTSSGGGSGQFSTLLSMQRNGNSAHITALAGGDRCNGGVFAAKQAHNTLSYHVNITPADLLPLAHNDPHHLKAYDDLAACAACCVGDAVYTSDLNHLHQQTLTAVNFTVTDAKSLPVQGKYQDCFNKLLLSKAYQNKTLTPEELKAFTITFNKECVR